MGRLSRDTLSWRGTAALALLALAGGLWRWGRRSCEALIEFCQQRLETFQQGWYHRATRPPGQRWQRLQAAPSDAVSSASKLVYCDAGRYPGRHKTRSASRVEVGWCTSNAANQGMAEDSGAVRRRPRQQGFQRQGQCTRHLPGQRHAGRALSEGLVQGLLLGMRPEPGRRTEGLQLRKCWYQLARVPGLR